MLICVWKEASFNVEIKVNQTCTYSRMATAAVDVSFAFSRIWIDDQFNSAAIAGVLARKERTHLHIETRWVCLWEIRSSSLYFLLLQPSLTDHLSCDTWHFECLLFWEALLTLIADCFLLADCLPKKVFHHRHLAPELHFNCLHWHIFVDCC